MENHETTQFVKEMIRFRKKHPVLRSRGEDALCGLPSVSFHGEEPWKLKEDDQNHLLGVLFAGREKDSDTDDIVYVMMNMHWEPHTVRLPELPLDYFWEIFSDTAGEPKNSRLPGGEYPDGRAEYDYIRREPDGTEGRCHLSLKIKFK